MKSNSFPSSNVVHFSDFAAESPYLIDSAVSWFAKILVFGLEKYLTALQWSECSCVMKTGVDVVERQAARGKVVFNFPNAYARVHKRSHAVVFEIRAVSRARSL